ncbi:Uncharacterised protein [Mycobacteroides abscessus subsp. massiliense]|nr:Uncharacterised protein [Mycobacteroides abscessus subsp. massiliense]SKS82514.1 Uncharacterised protein [Mycobacteroides abscessus subsp. abscessus]SKV15020.1 Uncharacterised protein [Mycobacteroides abscessus subsp. massiliense]
MTWAHWATQLCVRTCRFTLSGFAQQGYRDLSWEGIGLQQGAAQCRRHRSSTDRYLIGALRTSRLRGSAANFRQAGVCRILLGAPAHRQVRGVRQEPGKLGIGQISQLASRGKLSVGFISRPTELSRHHRRSDNYEDSTYRSKNHAPVSQQQTTHRLTISAPNCCKRPRRGGVQLLPGGMLISAVTCTSPLGDFCAQTAPLHCLMFATFVDMPLWLGVVSRP